MAGEIFKGLYAILICLAFVVFLIIISYFFPSILPTGDFPYHDCDNHVWDDDLPPHVSHEEAFRERELPLSCHREKDA